MKIRRAGLALLLASAAYADSLALRDGRVLEGNFIGGNPRQIQMEIGGVVRTFAITDVANISFSGAPPAAGARMYQPGPASTPPPVVGLYQPDPTYGGLAQGGPAYGRELPVGTRIVVRMIDSVDSERNRLGQTFRASLDEPVYVNGQQVVPRGSEAIVRLVDARESGKIAGRSSLTLSLQSVLVNGRMLDINTQSVSAVSGSRGARTAKVAGGGAALGAAIGAIAGGGKGAAIGAGAGAGAGVGAEVLTRGQRVHIPSETRLSFNLETMVRF